MNNPRVSLLYDILKLSSNDSTKSVSVGGRDESVASRSLPELCDAWGRAAQDVEIDGLQPRLILKDKKYNPAILSAGRSMQ